MNTPVVEKVIKQLETLPDDLQQQVLVFVQGLSHSAKRGVPGQTLLQFAGSIPQDDLRLMEEAIEAGCEQVDSDEW